MCVPGTLCCEQLAQGGSDSTSNDVNVVQTDKTVEVEAELPGDSKEDLSVAVDKRRMTIKTARALAQNKAGTVAGPRPPRARPNFAGSMLKHGTAGQ